VGGRWLSKVHPEFHMPPAAILVTAIISGAVVFIPSATVFKIIAFAVVGILYLLIFRPKENIQPEARAE
jgi:amino acid transporter